MEGSTQNINVDYAESLHKLIIILGRWKLIIWFHNYDTLLVRKWVLSSNKKTLKKKQNVISIFRLGWCWSIYVILSYNLIGDWKIIRYGWIQPNKIWGYPIEKWANMSIPSILNLNKLTSNWNTHNSILPHVLIPSLTYKAYQHNRVPSKTPRKISYITDHAQNILV